MNKNIQEEEEKSIKSECIFAECRLVQTLTIIKVRDQERSHLKAEVTASAGVFALPIPKPAAPLRLPTTTSAL